MKIVYTIIKIVILLAFVLLAVSNTQMTAFHYLPGQAVNLPLIVLLLAFFVVGAVFGVLSLFGRLLTLRNEINRLRSELKKSARVVLADEASQATKANSAADAHAEAGKAAEQPANNG